MKNQGWSKRDFLRLSGVAGAALVLGLFDTAQADEATIVKAPAPGSENIELNTWISVAETGKVTLVCHRSEMGQGIYQAIPQIIAEELEVDLAEVDVRFAQGDSRKYGSQVTGGSSTIRGSYKKLLRLSAAAREMLVEAAARRWSVPAGECQAKAGSVVHEKTAKKARYGELIADASKLPVPASPTLKKRGDYKLIGQPLVRKDSALKTNGTAVFGLDKRLPGMLFAVVERNPRLRGKVKTFDDGKALQVPGVKKVFKIRMAVFNTYREGVAVVADSTWAAMEGRKALTVEWDDTGFEHLDTETIYGRMRDLLAKDEGLTAHNQGDPNPALAAATDKLDVVYETPYQAHSCMEPLNCVSHYQGDKVEIWGPIQAPEWVQDCLTKEFGIPREKIIINLTFLGGGFGRKAFMDYPHEATVISKEMGVPIQVVWTREDDTTQGPYRPGVTYRCEGAVANGGISALKVRLAGQNNGHWMGGPKNRANGSTMEGFLRPYLKKIAHARFSDVPFETPIPTMWWRSVYASTNGFAYESFLDELAHKAGKDPLEFRKAHLEDERCLRLLEQIAEMSGWKTRKPNEGYGVAVTSCFGSTVAQVVKVSQRPESGVKIDRVWAAIDCGWYVNPDTIRAQLEGSIVMALGAATAHEITFRDGMTVPKNFDVYRMPRITDIPAIQVHIMENTAEAGGVGEPGLPPFAPALANAVFDLTGKRVRKLPFDLSKV